MSSSRPAVGAPVMLAASCILLALVGGCRDDERLGLGCGAWRPMLEVEPVEGSESSAVRVRWSGDAPTACLGDGEASFHHVELHRSDGVLTGLDECSSVAVDAPSVPTAETLLAELTSDGTALTDEIGLPGRAFAYTVFGCRDETCSSWFADGTREGESVETGTARTCTEPERWLLTHIGGERDAHVHALWDPAELFALETANAAEIVMVPDDWKDEEAAGHVVMYFGVAGTLSASGASEIYAQVADVAGWPDGGFNCDHRDPCPGDVPCCDGDDGGPWRPARVVLKGSVDEMDDDYDADHPWVMLTEDGGDQRVVLYAQSNHEAEDWSVRIVQVRSDDGRLDEFGLDCDEEGWCGGRTLLDGNDAGVLIHPDGTEAYGYVEHARHGRIQRDYLADAFVRRNGPCAEAWQPGCPVMLWMADLQDDDEGLPCYEETKNPDDITMSTAVWNDLGASWTWPIRDDDGDGCVDIVLEDRRDPAIIPLGGERFKVYSHGAEADPVTVATWDGESFSAGAAIEFAWDGAQNEGGPDYACIDNIATFAAEVDGVVREGMILRIRDSDSGCGVGLDDDSTETSGDGRLVFAEHVN